MKPNQKFFNKSKLLPVDEFYKTVLYKKNYGYYSTKIPFGEKGDYITSPKISYLFSEMIAIWLVSTWEVFNKPKKFYIVELGPGDGSLTKVLLNTFKKFPKFNSSKKIYLYEKNKILKDLQKKNINNKEIKWLNDLKKLKNGPIIFFGNEFLDAIPIKQFVRKKNLLFEKNYFIDKNFQILKKFKKAQNRDLKIINSYKCLRQLKFIEFPKLGYELLKTISKKVAQLKGCILLIDYGYLKSNNQNTIQSVFKHKKNNPLNNLGKADITSHVNFKLLNEFFKKNNLKTKKTISQSKFLRSLGIIERAEIINKKLLFKDQTNLYLRLKRLLSPNSMGNLFKVNLAYKFKKKDYAGFD